MDFWSQFWPQFAATVIGVVLGIPAALILNRYLEGRTEKERKREILLFIFQELENNVRGIDGLERESNYLIKTTRLVYRLKDEFWDAYSESGEIKWIKDLELLGTIAGAYYYIRMLLALSNRYLDMLNLYEFDMDRKGRNYVMESLDEGILETQEDLTIVMDAIKEVLVKESMIEED